MRLPISPPSRRDRVRLRTLSRNEARILAELPSPPGRTDRCDSFVAMGVGHYENFPVASLLLPARLRPAVRAIYRFARTADDVADEGDALPADRLRGTAGAAAANSTRWTRPDTRWPDLAARRGANTRCRCLCSTTCCPPSRRTSTTRRYADYAGAARLLPALREPDRAPAAGALPPRRARTARDVRRDLHRRCNSPTSGRTSRSTGTRDASICRRRIWRASPSTRRRSRGGKSTNTGAR